MANQEYCFKLYEACIVSVIKNNETAVQRGSFYEIYPMNTRHYDNVDASWQTTSAIF